MEWSVWVFLLSTSTRTQRQRAFQRRQNTAPHSRGRTQRLFFWHNANGDASYPRSHPAPSHVTVPRPARSECESPGLAEVWQCFVDDHDCLEATGSKASRLKQRQRFVEVDPWEEAYVALSSKGQIFGSREKTRGPSTKLGGGHKDFCDGRIPKLPG